MGSTMCNKQPRVIDIFMSFTFLVLVSRKAAATRSINNGHHRRVDVQIQTSDSKHMSSYLHQLQLAEESTVHAHGHTLQPAGPTGVSGRIGMQASGGKLTYADSVAQTVDPSKVQSRDVGAVPAQLKRTTTQLSSSGHSDTPPPRMQSHMQGLSGHTKRIDLELSASNSASEAAKMTSTDRMHAQAAETGTCMYTISVVTGKKWGAGTDATISLQLFNKDGDQVYFLSLDNGKNNFEKGHVDEFAVMGECVDKICKMVLSTDNSGFFADWYVDTLGFSVTTPGGGHQEKTWELHQWLPKDDAAASLFVVKDDCSNSSGSIPPKS